MSKLIMIFAIAAFACYVMGDVTDDATDAVKGPNVPDGNQNGDVPNPVDYHSKSHSEDKSLKTVNGEVVKDKDVVNDATDDNGVVKKNTKVLGNWPP